MMPREVFRDPRYKSSFLATIILIVVVAVVCAAVNAKLSMYDDEPGSVGRVAAKATKLHECSVDRVNITPVVQVVMRLAADCMRTAVRVEPLRPQPATVPHFDRAQFLRPPPAHA